MAMLVVLVLLVWNTCVSMLLIAFSVTICYILYKEFEYLGRTFEMKIGADGTFTDDLDRFRISHQNRYNYLRSVGKTERAKLKTSSKISIPQPQIKICIIHFSKLSTRLTQDQNQDYKLTQGHLNLCRERIEVARCCMSQYPQYPHRSHTDLYEDIET